MEFGQVGKDGTGSHLDPQKFSLRDASSEASYKSQIAYWDLKKSSDLSATQNFPGVGQRDLLPHIDMVPQPEGYRSNHTQSRPPENFFAIANRQDGMPLEVLEYTTDRSGELHYKQQYLFHYQNLPDGQNRVTVQNWAPDDGNHPQNPKITIGNKENILLGLSQYYRTGNETTKAEYWSAASITAAPQAPRRGVSPENSETRTPDIRITFNNGANDIKLQEKQLSGLLGGGILESGSQAKYDLKRVLPKYSFYDLFGPKL